MVGDTNRVSVEVRSSSGKMTSAGAVRIGLITTELVINALKHAFPGDATGGIVIRYATSESEWQLSVSDNGVGISSSVGTETRQEGLGTSIIEALAHQLAGNVVISGARSAPR